MWLLSEPNGLSYNTPMKILFLHGWQSTPGGRKPTYLNDHGHEVLNPVLPKDDFDAAVRIARADFDQPCVAYVQKYYLQCLSKK